MGGMVHSGHPEVDIWSSIADRRFRDLELGLGLDLLIFFASFERECGFGLARKYPICYHWRQKKDLALRTSSWVVPLSILYNSLFSFGSV